MADHLNTTGLPATWHDRACAWLEKHWADARCYCGSADFGVAAEPVQLFSASDVTKSHGAAMVVCDRCGHIELVSLKTVAGGGE